MMKKQKLNGKDLISMGFEQGAYFNSILSHFSQTDANDISISDIHAFLEKNKIVTEMIPANDVPVSYKMNINATNDDEKSNIESVVVTMDELMKTPYIVDGAVMPDAMPSGKPGTIPVGGVVASERIHPGMHSSDVCCSLMITDMGKVDPKDVLDSMSSVTHFGAGGRRQGERFTVSHDLLNEFEKNRFLADAKIMRAAQEQMGTQGDGNHFSFVGISGETGNTCLVTHHGSRGVGAGMYKLGMREAENFRKSNTKGVMKCNAWIPDDLQDEYWNALQLVRKWTKANHNALHQSVCERLRIDYIDRFWNEHNFVFLRDGLFYHAKGATPAFDNWADDATERTIIPMNMGEPVLIVRGKNNKNALGFSPHGAGRNFSRSEHSRRNSDITKTELFEKETSHIDARFFSGVVDTSELPSAYKNAETVRNQINEFELADVLDEIKPYGCIMGGDFSHLWKKNRKKGGRN